METINGIPKKYSISLTQTAKGYFYVDKLGIEADTEEELIKKLDSIVKEVKNRLIELNKEE